MKAAVLHAPLDLRIEDRSEPSFGDEDVLVRVRYNGLCGTDATEYSKGPMMVPLRVPHPGSGHVGPTILGHEFIGEVVDAGSAVRHRVGERIACGAGVSCGACVWCLEGRTNLCERYYTLGLSTHGGLAEYVAAPSGICTEVPPGLGDEDAALAQPLAVGLHSVARSGLRPGDTVVLLGVGAIGTFICAGLSGHDGPVIAMDIDETRLAVARTLGATEAIKIAADVTPSALREMLPDGAHTVFETSGVPGSAQRAMTLARRGGTVLLVGLTKSPQELTLSDIVLREIDVRTTVAHVCATDIPAALALLSRQKLASALPTRVVPLDDVVDRGLKLLMSGTAGGKILVDPRG